MTLLRWDADRSQWTNAGLTVVERDAEQNRYGVTLVQPGEYAFFSAAPSGARKTIYLPLITQNTPAPIVGAWAGRVYLPLISQEWQE